MTTSKSNISVQLLTIYNSIQTIVVIYLLIRFFSHAWLFIPMIIFVIITTYFLNLGKKWAWRVLLIWYFLLLLDIELISFVWEISFGIELGYSFSLIFGGTKIALAFDLISIIPIVLLLNCKKHFFKKNDINAIRFNS